ncbi:hypothetical protein [Halorubrum yunnanense]|uniref:DUF8135 domain-containing protein n=1 Tax=Halorubrum yunnanense TaxID=1526162 RepID=A0ABD5YDE0_9EURY|nr:hypothetical protein [Halorubrum yunnanense]
MSDEGDGPRGEPDADEGSDAFDSLDDLATETDDPDEVDDPFAELGAGVDAEGPDSSPADSDPADSSPADSDPADFDPADPDARRDDPFDELGSADSETDLDDAFERMDVGGAAEEDVWESLEADAEGIDGAGALGAATSASGDTEHVVSKRTYCQQCPHFTSPPEAACTHEGTSILEAVGFDEFRVRNCPMISEEDPTFDADE